MRAPGQGCCGLFTTARLREYAAARLTRNSSVRTGRVLGSRRSAWEGICYPGGDLALAVMAIRDRLVQTASKLVIEPIFEADLEPNAYGRTAEGPRISTAGNRFSSRLRASHFPVAGGSAENAPVLR